MADNNGSKLSWKPVRRGDIYCSPGCGAKCTWHDYRQAVVESDKLATKLGPGWSTRVWENMGWHYSVHHTDVGVISVHVSRLTPMTRYTAYIDHRWVDSAESPQEAIRGALAKFSDYLGELSGLAERLIPLFMEYGANPDALPPVAITDGGNPE